MNRLGVTRFLWLVIVCGRNYIYALIIFVTLLLTVLNNVTFPAYRQTLVLFDYRIQGIISFKLNWSKMNLTFFLFFPPNSVILAQVLRWHLYSLALCCISWQGTQSWKGKMKAQGSWANWDVGVDPLPPPVPGLGWMPWCPHACVVAMGARGRDRQGGERRERRKTEGQPD